MSAVSNIFFLELFFSFFVIQAHVDFKAPFTDFDCY